VSKVKQITESQKEIVSTTKLSRQLKISRRSVGRILKIDLTLRPYLAKTNQTFGNSPEAVIEKRLQAALKFISIMESDPDFHRKIWFSDESHFNLDDSQVNRRKNPIWSDKQPNIYLPISAHPKRLTIWAAMHHSKEICSLF